MNLMVSISIASPEPGAAINVTGVAFNPGDLFFIDAPRRNHLRLTFAGAEPEHIGQGVRVLGDIVRRFVTRTDDRRAARGETVPLV